MRFLRPLAPLLLVAIAVGCGSSSSESGANGPPGGGGGGSSGNVRWVRTFADDYVHSPETDSPITPDLVASSVATRASGGVVFGAKLFGGTDVGNGALGAPTDSTAFFAALDGDGKNAGLGEALKLGPDVDGKTGSIYSIEVASDAQSNTIIAAIVSGAVTIGTDTHTCPVGTLGVLVAKLDPSGKLVWSRFTQKATQTYAWGLAVDGSGNIWLSGSVWSGAIDFGDSPTKSLGDAMYVAKLDPNGKTLFIQAFDVKSPKFSPSFGAIGVDAKGNAVTLAPGLTGSVDLGGTMLMPGDKPATVLVRFDANGTVTSAKTLPDVRSITGFAAGASGEVVLSGGCTSTLDLGAGSSACDGGWIAKLSSSDGVTWLKTFADPKNAQVGSTSTGGTLAVSHLALDPAGNIAFGGYLVGDGSLDGTALKWTPGKRAADGYISSDALVGAFDTDGKLLFARAFGDGESQVTTSVAFDTTGNVVAVGWFAGSMTLDTAGTFTSKKADDVFVASFSR